MFLLNKLFLKVPPKLEFLLDVLKVAHLRIIDKVFSLFSKAFRKVKPMKGVD